MRQCSPQSTPDRPAMAMSSPRSMSSTKTPARSLERCSGPTLSHLNPVDNAYHSLSPQRFSEASIAERGAPGKRQASAL